MKKGRWLLILGIIILVVGLQSLHLLLPGLILMTGSFDLAPSNVSGPSLFVPLSSMTVLDLSVDGANRDVFFYITKGSAERVLDAGRVYDGYHLEWTSPSFSSYTFNFDNTMSLTSHKQVTYDLQVYPYSTIFLFLGLILLVGAVLQIVREEKVVSRVKSYLFKQPESQHVACE